MVGLGNPGRQYARTRHNVGFEVIETLRRRLGLDKGRKAFDGIVTEWPSPCDGCRRVFLLQPQTFMNLSGRSAGTLAGFYKVAPPDVLVVLDDLALPLGQLRARAQGSAGGHKGLSDVLAALGTPDVPRLRIGIGPRPAQIAGTDFVLGTFAPAEQPVVQKALELTADAVLDWVRQGIAFVMNRYNSLWREETQDTGTIDEPHDQDV